MMRSLVKSAPLLAIALVGAVSCSDNETKDQQNRNGTGAPATGKAKDAAAATAGKAADSSKLLQEAMAALQETQTALTAIDQKKPDDAIAALERATGKLEILLARSPDLALAPVDQHVVTHNILADVNQVKALRERAEEALEDGRIQEARHLIDGLASETVISVSSLPLATYPDAIKEAAALLAKNKPQDAKEVLLTALSTIVVRDTIIPLPMTRAQAALNEAKQLAAKQSRSAADNNRIKSLIGTARQQLELTRALGYATKRDLDELSDTLNEIERETGEKRSARQIFDRIEQLFEGAKQASQPKEN